MQYTQTLQMKVQWEEALKNDFKDSKHEVYTIVRLGVLCDVTFRLDLGCPFGVLTA